MSKMNMDEMIMVSVDDHLIEPADMFIGRMPQAYADSTPRVGRFANGDERWIVEGKPWGGIGTAAVAGRRREELGNEPTHYGDVRLGTWQVDARVDDMNANGTLASLNFAKLPGFAGEKLVGGKDKALMLAIIQAYNDWHIEEWVGAHPGRFIANAILPLWDIDLAIAELRRVGARGCGSSHFRKTRPRSICPPSTGGIGTGCSPKSSNVVSRSRFTSVPREASYRPHHLNRRRMWA